jgi:hypothetical protein
VGLRVDCVWKVLVSLFCCCDCVILISVSVNGSVACVGRLTWRLCAFVCVFVCSWLSVWVPTYVVSSVISAACIEDTQC